MGFRKQFNLDELDIAKQKLFNVAWPLLCIKCNEIPLINTSRNTSRNPKKFCYLCQEKSRRKKSTIKRLKKMKHGKCTKCSKNLICKARSISRCEECLEKTLAYQKKRYAEIAADPLKLRDYMEKQRIYSLESRKRRIKGKTCTRCSGVKDDKDYSTCSRCRSYAKHLRQKNVKNI